MTKTYLGYGYTNNRGVARLQYNPNDEPVEPSGYKNNNNYDTQVSASFSHQSKEYESNKKYYEKDPSSGYFFFDDQSTDKTSEYVSAPNSIPISYVHNEYLSTNGAYSIRYNTPFIIKQGEHWIFEAEINSENNQSMLGVSFHNLNHYYIQWAYYNPLRLEYVDDYLSPTLDSSPQNILTTNKWYYIKWEIYNGELIASIYNEGNLVYGTTVSFPSFFYNMTLYFLIAGMGTAKFRNIKIKKVEE